ncbi:InlB B-repeat-containing protein, partial [Adlercreutzia sp. ZJ304]|uniref:InlB B-repeat-containing protein n=1 Tax=Adlercreutzia sp. ZJ304 TaxID=2709791 RepID=UPI0013EDF283
HELPQVTVKVAEGTEAQWESYFPPDPVRVEKGLPPRYKFVGDPTVSDDANEQTIGSLTYVKQADGTFGVKVADGVTLPADFSISDAVQGTGLDVTRVIDNGFAGQANLISIALPSCITTIGANAFKECPNLAEVVIPASVTSVGSQAYWGCPKLERILALPENATYDKGVFVGTAARSTAYCPAENAPALAGTGLEFIKPFELSLDKPNLEFFVGDAADTLNVVGAIPNTDLFGGFFRITWGWQESTNIAAFTTTVNSFTGSPVTVTPSTQNEKSGDANLQASLVYYGYSGEKVIAVGNCAVKVKPMYSDVTFQTNGAESGDIAAQNHLAYGSKVAKPADPTKTGYTFGGWFTDAECTDGNQWNFDTSVVTKASITLYAKWTADSHPVTFKANYDAGEGYEAVSGAVFGMGEEASADDVVLDLYYGDKYDTVPTPTYTGYIFDGWYTDPGTWEQPTNQPTADTTVGTEDVIYYAKWTICSYAVTYNKNLGADPTEPTTWVTDPEGGTISYGASLDYTPVRSGYTFTGWTRNASPESGSVVVDYPAAADEQQLFTPADANGATINLYAVWQPAGVVAYTVKYFQQNVDDDNYPSAAAQTTTTNTAAAGTTIDSTLINSLAAAYSPDGFTYNNYTINDSQTVIRGDAGTVINCYYTRNAHSITLDASNTGILAISASLGSAALANGAEVKQGATVNLSATVVSGYNFSGWTVTDDKGVAVTVTNSNSASGASFVMPNSVVTISASATAGEVTYTIIYNKQNIENDEYTKFKEKTVKCNVGETVTHDLPTYEGFTTPAKQNVTAVAGGGTIAYNYARQSYTLTFNLNTGALGDSSAAITEQVKYEDALSKYVPAGTPTKDGYVFVGWFNGSEKLTTTSTTKMPANNVTYTASYMRVLSVDSLLEPTIGMSLEYTDAQAKLSQDGVDSLTLSATSQMATTPNEESGVVVKSVTSTADTAGIGALFNSGSVSASNSWGGIQMRVSNTGVTPNAFGLNSGGEVALVDATNGASKMIIPKTSGKLDVTFSIILPEATVNAITDWAATNVSIANLEFCFEVEDSSKAVFGKKTTSA